MIKLLAILYTVSLSFFLPACGKKDGYSDSSVYDNSGGYNPVNPPAAKRYLALGDSYTIGQSVAVNERFPIQTQAWLQQNGISLKETQIIATTGWTTLNLQSAINQSNPTGPFDVVSLLIGVNDQYQGLDTAGYRVRFTQLLQKSVSLAGGLPSHVFVVSIPDYSVTPYASHSDTARIRKEIDWFNVINKQVSVQYAVQYLDITPSTREAKDNLALLAPDGLHPSGMEYKKWADRLGPLMKPVLQ